MGVAIKTFTIGSSDAGLAGEAGDRWRPLGFETSFVRVNDVNLHVAQAGAGDIVVLLHGYPQTGEAWRKIATEISKDKRVIIPDLRGMGLSDFASNGCDLLNLAEDLNELLRSMKCDSVKLVGHDWGGSVAVVYALRYPTRVTKLAFLESALPGAGFETLWNFQRPNPTFCFIPFLLMGSTAMSLDVTVELLTGRESIFLRHLWEVFTGDKNASPFGEWQAYVQAMSRPGIAASSSAYYRAAYESADQVRGLLAQSKLRIPVLSIAGEKGIGAGQAALVAQFAADVVGNLVIAGAGHFLAEERPAELIQALRGFLK